jgi:CheY-like chemotaxis protein
VCAEVVTNSPKKLRVLVVEDHPDTRLVLKAIVESLGHKVTTAATLREGRECLRSSEIDVAFSDLQLPDGMGWDLLKNLPLPPHFAAFAISGHVDSFHKEMQEAGFRRRIDKPLSKNDIADILNELATETP